MGLLDLVAKQLVQKALGSVGTAAATGGAVVLGAAAGGLATLTKRPFKDNIFNSSGYLVFPRDLERFQLSMCFQFLEYKRRSIFDQVYQQATQTIRLPVAKNIVDKYNMTWEVEKDQPLVGAAIENLQGGGMSQIFSALKTAGPAGVVAQLATTYAVPGAIQAGQMLLQNNPLGITMDKVLQPFGVAVNPFLTVLFKQPNFKKYSFTWKLIPKNPDEARRINAIIQTFKYHLLPDISQASGGALLNYPSMVQISFFGKDNYLFRFKPCVIENMEINYAPQGVSFFKGDQNVPTEIDLTLSLMEIEYWTKLDFERGYIPNRSPS